MRSDQIIDNRIELKAKKLGIECNFLQAAIMGYAVCLNSDQVIEPEPQEEVIFVQCLITYIILIDRLKLGGDDFKEPAALEDLLAVKLILRALEVLKYPSLPLNGHYVAYKDVKNKIDTCKRFFGLQTFAAFLDRFCKEELTDALNFTTMDELNESEEYKIACLTRS